MNIKVTPHIGLPLPDYHGKCIMGITDIPYHMVFKWPFAKLIFCRFLYLTGINPNVIRENTFDIQLILHDNSRVYLNNFFILARVSLFKSI